MVFEKTMGIMRNMCNMERRQGGGQHGNHEKHAEHGETVGWGQHGKHEKHVKSGDGGRSFGGHGKHEKHVEYGDMGAVMRPWGPWESWAFRGGVCTGSARCR